MKSSLQSPKKGSFQPCFSPLALLSFRFTVVERSVASSAYHVDPALISTPTVYITEEVLHGFSFQPHFLLYTLFFRHELECPVG